MNELPKSIEERLEALTGDFLARIPERMHEIRSLMDQAESGSRESLRALRLCVHRIAGSAVTFGYELLGSSARCLEERTERDLSTEVRVPSKSTREAFHAFTHAMDQVGRQADDLDRKTDEDTAGPATVPAASYDRSVVLVGDVPGLPDDFGDQVAVFRFAVSFAAAFEVVPEFCNVRLRQGDTEETTQNLSYRYVVLIAAVSHFSEKPSRLKRLTRLREEYDKKIVLILVGDEDDFPTRLRSVRYGADAFLSTPIDITRFVDKIDSLTAHNSPEPYHILIVDDDPEQVSDTALILQEAGMITSVVTDPRNIFKVLVEYGPELILMDMYMPECTGSELAAIIRQNESFVGVPILYLSVETDAERQLSAIQSGGDGFLVKPIDRAHLVTAVSVRAARTRAMRFFMERDSLTGLLNHTNLKQHLEQEIQRARRIGLSLVFVMIDLDRFKSVNDTYGHLTGDRVIKSLARLLQERLRRSDTIGRYGGEEFGVVLFNTDASWAKTIMEEIRESFERIRQSDGHREFTVTLSCGIAEFPLFETASEVNEAADAALYRAKKSGRNRVIVAQHDSLAR